MDDKNMVSCLCKYGDSIDGFQTQTVIWESLPTEGCKIPSNYTSARPDLQIRIHHWWFQIIYGWRWVHKEMGEVMIVEIKRGSTWSHSLENSL